MNKMKVYVKECQSCGNIVDKATLPKCSCGGEIEIEGTDYPYFDFWTRCLRCNRTSEIYNNLESLFVANRK